MGLVKTRRLAAMQKQQRAKAAMKLSVKGGARKGDGVFLLRDGCTDKGKVYR